MNNGTRERTDREQSQTPLHRCSGSAAGLAPAETKPPTTPAPQGTPQPQHEQSRAVLGNPRMKKTQEQNLAKAQELLTPRFPYKLIFKIASINVRGTNQPGKWDEIEMWMTENNVRIALLQETRQATNSKVQRKQYIWYFSGENPINPNYTSGVGIVIHSEYKSM